jgi:hypothetical protein
VLTTAEATTVEFEGSSFSAEPIARGAAYQLFSDSQRDGFSLNPHNGPRFRRVVHASDVALLAGPEPGTSDPAIKVPLSRTMNWDTAHRLTQSRGSASSPTLREMRESATVQSGTRMVKILSGRQLSGYLRGWLPMGFCHREYDIAHLRTPAELAVLSTDGRVEISAPVVFALRWRAAGPEDFAVPYADEMPGLMEIPPHDRVGAPVLGTGFALSSRHIVPEFTTADMFDLPMPAHAELVAFTADGAEVLLYGYLAEQRAWGRLAGPQWRHLLTGVDGVAADQEYFPVPAAPTQMVGMVGGNVLEAVADPPNDFWLLAKVRALRQPVQAPARRTPLVTWRDTTCSLVRDGDDWARVRLTNPDPESVARLGATCVERGVYEAWAPASEFTRRVDHVVRYATSTG